MDASSKKSIRVLIVDDDPDDALLTRLKLEEIESARFEIEAVSDFDTGIRRLSDGGNFDVCLVDYRLGARTGVEFVAKASMFCSSPLIVLTGQGDHSVDVAAMNAGAADFLHKGDITPSTLERSIRYAIQHRRAEEQRISLLRAQAERAEAEAANRAKDEFLAKLSHELRTPLTPVLAILSMWRDDPSLPQQIKDDVAMLQRNVQLEARLIDDLLDITRITRGKLQLQLENVRAHDIIQQACQTVQYQAAEKKVVIALHLDARHDWVWADPVRLEQTFWNVLTNAVKFTPSGGNIAVRTEDLAEKRIRVTITDTGRGIDAKILPHIFDAFEQGHLSGEARFAGLGLGLAITRSLIEMHGGTISAASDGPGTGSTFTIELDAAAEPNSTSNRPARTRKNGLSAMNILLVEDHLNTATVMTRVLKNLGHTVQTANTAQAALKLATRQRFDLLVSDLGLPDATGIELLQQIRSRYPLFAIAVSGFGMESDIRRSLDAGFDQHLTKPVTVEALSAAIEAIGRLSNGSETSRKA